MADNSRLKQSEQLIRDNIRPNGVKAITAQILQDTLTGITEAAIADLATLSGNTDEVIANYVFGTDNYGNKTITGSKLANSAVTADIIALSAVTESKIAANAVTNAKIANGAVTEPKLASNSVTTTKIVDRSVTKVKLSTDVSDKLLTDEQEEYINKKLREELEQEAQEKFVGTTTNGGTTKFVYGKITPANARKQVAVNLTFDGVETAADTTPTGWTRSGMEYRYDIGLSGSTTSVAATKFNYTAPSGKYQGITVEYTSNAASVNWNYPVFYGFVSGNTLSIITASTLATMNYVEGNVNTTTSLTNNLNTDAYLCIVTRNSATATQLGMSILGPKQGPTQFTSPNNPQITMSGYYAYFSTNTVSPGGSLNNVALVINQ